MKTLVVLLWLGVATLIGIATQAQAPELVTQFLPGESATSAAIAPDLSFVVTGGDEAALLWDVATGRQLRQFTISDDAVTSVDISGDSRSLLTVQGGAALLWNIESGELIARLLGSQRQTWVDRLLFGETHGGTDRNPFRDPIDSARFLGSSSEIVTAAPVKLWSPPYQRARSDLEFMGDAAIPSADGRYVVAIDTFGGPEVFDTQQRRRVASLNTAGSDDAAITPDGSRVVNAGSNGVAVYDVRSGEMVAQLTDAWTRTIELRPDGRQVAIANSRGTTLVDLQDPKRNRQIDTEGADALAYSADGRRLLAVMRESLRLWDTETGMLVREFAGTSRLRISNVANSDDGRFLAVTNANDGLWLWDLEGQLRPRFIELPSYISFFDFESGNGNLIAVHSDDVSIIDPQNRVPVSVVPLESADEYSLESTAAISRDGRYVARPGLFDHVVTVFNLRDGSRVSDLRGHTDAVREMVFSPDGRLVATAASGESVRLWRVADGELLQTLSVDSPAWVAFMGFRDNDTLVVLDGNGGNVNQVTPDAQSLVMSDENLQHLSADGARASTNGPIVFDVASSRRLMNEELEELYYTESHLSADGRWLYTKHAGGVTLWDVDGRRKLWQHITPGNARGFFLNGPYAGRMAAVVTDGAVELLDFQSGRRLARLVGGGDGEWMVLTDDGRFDTSNIDALKALNWVLPANRMKPLPIESFMRQYFQPGLLTRVLRGEPMQPVADIRTLNISLPQVSIAGIEQEACAPEPCVRDTVAVDVQVRSVADSADKPASGVFDLRLFRDGRLVAYREGEIADGVVRMDHIRVPRSEGRTQATFTAYAFNSSRVKSETAEHVYDIPDLAPRRGTAYIVSVGVNSFENPSWDLTFASDDAEGMATELQRELAANSDISEVVPIVLLSDRHANVSNASKDNIRQVLALLAGRPGQPTGLRDVGRIREARPEDVVIVTFSSHGYANENGDFYLFPQDIGAGEGRRVTDALLAKAISSNEMKDWFMDIDAGDLVFIIDACESAASVEGAEFTPGPMGSPGLGQLAYDKGMRILAATQADRPAYETRAARHGLLTYTLLQRGLLSGEADYLPKNGTILLSEWLSYATSAMSAIYGEMKGAPATRGVQQDAFLPQGDLYDPVNSYLQQPSLFDFARSESLILKSLAP